jgi:hypothetical protein
MLEDKPIRKLWRVMSNVHVPIHLCHCCGKDAHIYHKFISEEVKVSFFQKLADILFSVSVSCKGGKVPLSPKLSRDGAGAESYNQIRNIQDTRMEADNHALPKHQFPVSKKVKVDRKKVRFIENEHDSIGDHADEASQETKRRNSTRIPVEEHYDDCGDDHTSILEADQNNNSTLFFDLEDYDKDIHEAEEHNFQSISLFL